MGITPVSSDLPALVRYSAFQADCPRLDYRISRLSLTLSSGETADDCLSFEPETTRRLRDQGDQFADFHSTQFTRRALKLRNE
jgi:hypothetical protein